MSEANGPSRKSGWLTRFVGRSKGLRKLCPDFVKRLGYRVLDMEGVFSEIAATEDPHSDLEEVSSYQPKVDLTLGIVKESSNRHKRYALACKDLGVPYRMVDISGPDWLAEVRNCQCDGLFIWPSTHLAVVKRMYDERLRIIVEDLGIPIFPGLKELWFYESKRRMAYWLEAHDIPHCRTSVFYSQKDAMAHAGTTQLPVVTKTNFGAGASGVNLFRDRRRLQAYVRRCFGKGITRPTGDRRDREWGEVIFQEYVKDAVEWRVLRLGDSYFGHQKLMKGDFHSGSGLVGWETPPERLLDFVREITEIGPFTSMDVDIFEAPDGRYLVNELQCMFGSYLPYQMLVDGNRGRFVRDEADKSWAFQEGTFNQNASCNLRVETFVRQLGKTCGKAQSPAPAVGAASPAGGERQ